VAGRHGQGWPVFRKGARGAVVGVGRGVRCVGRGAWRPARAGLPGGPASGQQHVDAEGREDGGRKDVREWDCRQGFDGGHCVRTGGRQQGGCEDYEGLAKSRPRVNRAAPVHHIMSRRPSAPGWRVAGGPPRRLSLIYSAITSGRVKVRTTLRCPHSVFVPSPEPRRRVPNWRGSRSGPAAGRLSSANTYTGPTTVNTGTLELNTKSGQFAVPGNLTINGGTVRDVTNGNQIANTAAVTVNPGGTFDINDLGDTFVQLTVVGGTVTTGGHGLCAAQTVTMTGGSIVAPAPFGELKLSGDLTIKVAPSPATLSRARDPHAA